MTASVIVHSECAPLHKAKPVWWKQRTLVVDCDPRAAGYLHRIVLRRTGYVSLPNHPREQQALDAIAGTVCECSTVRDRIQQSLTNYSVFDFGNRQWSFHHGLDQLSIWFAHERLQGLRFPGDATDLLVLWDNKGSLYNEVRDVREVYEKYSDAGRRACNEASKDAKAKASELGRAVACVSMAAGAPNVAALALCDAAGKVRLCTVENMALEGTSFEYAQGAIDRSAGNIFVPDAKIAMWSLVRTMLRRGAVQIGKLSPNNEQLEPYVRTSDLRAQGQVMARQRPR